MDIPWRITTAVYDNYTDLVERYKLIAHDEDCPEAHILRDEIASLPGFPNDADEFEDCVVPVLIDQPYFIRVEKL